MSSSCQCQRRIYSIVFWRNIFLVSGILLASTSASDSTSTSVPDSMTLVCPEGKTACPDNSECYSEDDVCDSIPLCFDRFDERDCSKSCSAEEFHCAVDDECFPLNYKCDGFKDCSDGSDEASCSNVTCSLEGEFMCESDKTCIVGSLRCDGTIHCHDGSDEENCDKAVLGHCESENSFDCLGDGTHCIPLHERCDGHEDCTDGEDESDPSCETNSTSGCSIQNGGCSHNCIKSEHGHHCECPDGLELGFDHVTCEDIDECDNHACSQDCKNFEGGFECTCGQGYHLADDLFTCLAGGDEPELWVTNRSSLVQYQLHSGGRKITNLGGLIHGFDYDHASGKIFWIDSLEKVIYWSNKDADNPPEVLVDTMKDVPAALSYDWVHNNLYWADAGRHVKIEVVTLENKWRTVILSPPEVDHPKAIVVDPRTDEGHVYWAQGGADPVIRRAGLDGSDPETMISVGIANVHALALDFADNRLYWVDSKLNILASLGLHNKDREVLTTFVEYPKHPIGIGVFEDYVYWADAESKAVYKMYKFRIVGEESPAVTTILEHVTSPGTVEIYHKLKQPEDNSYCGDNNGGCSHICLPSPHYRKFLCACPMSVGKTPQFIPDPDNSSSCVLLEAATTSTTLRPKNSSSNTAFHVAMSSSASMRSPTNFIFKSLSPSTYLSATTILWEPQFNTADSRGKEDGKVGENSDNMWLYIGIGGAAGILAVLLLSIIGYRLYARHVAKNLHFDNPVFEQKPLRTSDRQADSRA